MILQDAPLSEPDPPMIGSREQVERFVVLCVGDIGATAEPVLRALLHPLIEVGQVETMAQAAQRVDDLARQRIAVPVIVGQAAAMDSATLPSSLHQSDQSDPRPRPRLLAIAADEVPPAADALVEHFEDLADLTRSTRELLTDYLIEHEPAWLQRLCDLLDPRLLATALAESQRETDELDSRMRMLRHSISSASRLSDEAAEAQMLTMLRRALRNPREQQFQPGAVMFEADDHIDGIWVIVDGTVELTRHSGGRETVFHSKSVGRIVGLLALAGRQKTFFTARTVSPVTAIHLTWKELDDALQREPALLLYFMTVHVRSLGKRLRRIVELQLQIEDLNRDLAAERDHLADALRQLGEAQSRLIEQEKMATLGQLVAGVGHELNNPATAVTRASDYVVEDASHLIRLLPEGPALLETLSGAMASAPLPTEELRRRRDALETALGDSSLARRLLKVGITTVEAYRDAFGRDSADLRERKLALHERAYQLGTSLRNIRSSGERISAIVKSLRSYARGEDHAAEVNIHEGLEDTLLLFQVRLQGVHVVRRYGQIPAIRGWAAQLNQVWTNLISNALDAMDGRGELIVETEPLDGGAAVAVRIIDNGPGIPEAHRERIFDLNFTTKHAGAGFGLGMGLVICRQIVTRHHGQLSVESRPGRTCFQVILPTKPTEEEG